MNYLIKLTVLFCWGLFPTLESVRQIRRVKVAPVGCIFRVKIFIVILLMSLVYTL